MSHASVLYTFFPCITTHTFHQVFMNIQANGTVPPPHMIVVPLAQYDQEENKFETPRTCSKDKLLPKGHQYCRPEEYHLGKICMYIHTVPVKVSYCNNTVYTYREPGAKQE